MARGSPGSALSLATEGNLALDRLARRWVDEASLDRAEQMAMSDTFRGADGQGRFEALMDRLAAAVKARSLGADDGAAWADLWTRLSELPDRTAAVNLDRADVLSGALADLARVKAISRPC